MPRKGAQTYRRIDAILLVGVLMAALASLVFASVARAQDQPAVFWQGLGDTTLARLSAEALRANRDVVMAQARVRQARASQLNAKLDLAPAITFAGGYSRQQVSNASFGAPVADRSLWDAGLYASWELDVFGRLRKNLRGHNALTESSQEDVRDMGRIISADLATAYYAFRGSQERLVVLERNAENQRRTLQLTKSRLQAGRGTAFDVERAQSLLSTTLAFVPSLESQLAASRHRIGVLIGRDPLLVAQELEQPCSTGDEVECPLPELPADVALGQPDSLIRSRPDVRSAERRLAAETAFVGAAKAEYLPRLSVGGTAGYTSTSADAIGKQGTGRYAVGPVITWPALNLGRVKAGVDAAQAIEAESRAQYEQTVLLAREELETARVAYAKAKERLTQLEAAAAASSRAAELARMRFEGGVADFLQVLDAERSMLLTQDQLAQGRTDAVTALVAVYRAMGT